MTIFYKKDINNSDTFLYEDESRHCSQVLRHQEGDEIMIFDGEGGIYRSKLTKISKKRCEFDIIESKVTPSKPFKIHLAIAPTKNADRMEWLIEKLSEMGVDEVTLIQSKHSERKKMRLDRLEKKAVSAMKQSGNPFLLKIKDLVTFSQFIASDKNEIKLIAHVDDSYQYITEKIIANKSVTILIGPEGDFSADEVALAKQNGFETISLGKNTLRTETAGLMACCAINIINVH